MDTCRFNLHPAADLSKEWGPPPARGVTPRAIRWYMKGVQEGPNADGFVLLVTALEACIFRFKEQHVGVRRAVKDRLEHFGAKWQGRDDAVDALFRFRNAVIHEGLETREELVENYYVAEHIVRTLLRRELLQSSEEGWPEDIHDAGVEYYSRERPEAHAYYRTLRAHFLLE